MQSCAVKAFICRTLVYIIKNIIELRRVTTIENHTIYEVLAELHDKFIRLNLNVVR